MKIVRKNYQNLYVATDFHIGHSAEKDFIWEPRFREREDHDPYMNAFLDSLCPEDLLVYLGDLHLYSTEEDVMETFDRIRCECIYIYGNHESQVHRFLRKNIGGKVTVGVEDSKGVETFLEYKTASGGRIRFYGRTLDATVVYPHPEGRGRVIKRMVTFSHYPYEEWDRMNYGAYAIHGHCHGDLKTCNPDHKIGKRLDVAPDNAIHDVGRAAYNWEEIVKIMDKKEVDARHHGGE